MDKPFGIGQAIDEATRLREEEREAIEQIGAHITNYLSGDGPDLEAEDVELGRRLALLTWKLLA